MSDELIEIERKIAELEQRRVTILKEQRSEALLKVKELIRIFGFTRQELVSSKNQSEATRKTENKNRHKNAVYKYKNPSTGEIWEGNINNPGRKPSWVSDLIKSQTIEDHRVPEATPAGAEISTGGVVLPDQKADDAAASSTNESKGDAAST